MHFVNEHFAMVHADNCSLIIVLVCNGLVARFSGLLVETDALYLWNISTNKAMDGDSSTESSKIGQAFVYRFRQVSH